LPFLGSRKSLTNDSCADKQLAENEKMKAKLSQSSQLFTKKLWPKKSKTHMPLSGGSRINNL
ncbi:MAG TPA: hypothetical protein VJC18_02320, partial [bacterium]|nr:hypothetical protein [bacterium]